MQDSPPSDFLQQRKQLRREAIAIRNALSPEERAQYSREVTELLIGYLTQARSIHSYLSFRSEVDTRGFIEASLLRGLRVIVPVVEELDGRQVLVHTEIRNLSKLTQGMFGVEEPVERNPYELDTLDAIIVPLVAFDRHGTRLGYGKGFYDAFLHDMPRSIPRIGLAFSSQEVHHIPALPHDEPLDVVITEKEINRCG